MKPTQIIKLRPEAEALILSRASVDGLSYARKSFILPILAIDAGHNTVQTVAKYLHISQQGAGKLLRTMADLNIIAIANDTNDRRHKIISLAERGEALLKIIREVDNVELKPRE